MTDKWRDTSLENKFGGWPLKAERYNVPIKQGMSLLGLMVSIICGGVAGALLGLLIYG